MKHLVSMLFACALFTYVQAQTSSSLVSLSGGQLQYNKYAMTDTTNAENVIPDFSFAGYRQGGVALPEVPTVLSISPVAGDNTAHIQQAIDSVSGFTPDANGYRGAVLLKAGIYIVSDTISITTDGVVLRGEGQGENGTILIDTARSQHSLILLSGDRSQGFREDTAASNKTRIAESYVPVGSYKLWLNDPSIFSIEDTISVARTPNDQWILDLGMDSTTLCAGSGGGTPSSPPPISGPASSFEDNWGNPIIQDCTPIPAGTPTPSSGCRGWTAASYRIKYLRKVVDIVGDTLIIDMPIVDVMETKYGGGEVVKATYLGAVKESGIENLRIKSAFCGDDDEDHLWSAVSVQLAENCWVKNVTAQYIGYACVTMGTASRFNTVQDCAAKDFRSRVAGGRRYSFTIKNGVGNLFQRCYTSEGRHDFETGSRVTGPNVFLDCYSDNTNSDIGPHHRWSTGILFDNMRGGQFRVRNRKASGSGHGWTGNTIIFWNLQSYKSDIWVDSPTHGLNMGIGNEASTFLGAGFWEHQNTHVTPRSLYLQQLEIRRGTQAVTNITTAEQRSGTIYDVLRSWQGEGSATPTVFASEDAYVRGGTYDSTNYGSLNKLEVKRNDSNADFDRISYLKFDLSPYASGEVPTSAKLRLYAYNINDSDSSGITHRLYEVADNTWDESTLNYSNKPTLGTAVDSVDMPIIEDTWVEFDVSGLVIQAWNTDQLLSLAIEEKTSNHYVAFRSSEHSDKSLIPQVVFSYDTKAIAVEDAFVRGGTYADSTHDETKIVVKAHSGTNERISFLKFDLSNFSASNAPTIATLRLYMNNGDGPGITHKLYKAGSDNWNEASLTYNNMPTTGAVIDSVSLPDGDGFWVEYDVTGPVLAELAGDKILSLEISESTPNHYVSYYSSESSQTDKLPEIVMSFETTAPLLADAYVQGGSDGDTNFDRTTLVVKSASGSGNRESFLKFDLSSFSDENVPNGATLRLFMNNGDGAGVTHSLYMAGNDSWIEDSITFNNQPSIGTLISSVTLPENDDAWVEFDVSSQVSTELAGDKVISFELIETSSNHYVGYYSSESSSENTPRLELSFGGTPPPASMVVPESNPVSGIRTTAFKAHWYPNPVSGMLHSSIDFEAGSKLEVFTLYGTKVMDLTLSKGRPQIDFSHLPQGHYFLRVQSGKEVLSQRIVKY